MRCGFESKKYYTSAKDKSLASTFKCQLDNCILTHSLSHTHTLPHLQTQGFFIHIKAVFAFLPSCLLPSYFGKPLFVTCSLWMVDRAVTFCIGESGTGMCPQGPLSTLRASAAINAKCLGAIA